MLRVDRSLGLAPKTWRLRFDKYEVPVIWQEVAVGPRDSRIGVGDRAGAG